MGTAMKTMLTGPSKSLETTTLERITDCSKIPQSLIYLVLSANTITNQKLKTIRIGKTIPTEYYSSKLETTNMRQNLSQINLVKTLLVSISTRVFEEIFLCYATSNIISTLQ